jgi:hypothetical protein
MSNSARIAFLLVCALVVIAAIPLTLLLLHVFGTQGTAGIGGILLIAAAIGKYFERTKANRVRWTNDRLLLIFAAGVCALLAGFFPRNQVDLDVASASLLVWASQK